MEEHEHIQEPKVRPAKPEPPKPDIMKWFKWEHLKPGLPQEISKSFAAQAEYVEKHTKPGAEQSTALRKLLEAKDAAVRAALEWVM